MKLLKRIEIVWHFGPPWRCDLFLWWLSTCVFLCNVYCA